jgi:hypothetical protein
MSTKAFALEKPAELSLQTQPEIIVGHWHWQWHCATMLNAFTFFSVKRIHCARKGFTSKSLTRILLIEIDHFFPRTQSDLFCFSCHLFRRQFRFRFGNVAFQLLVSKGLFVCCAKWVGPDFFRLWVGVEKFTK